MVKLDIPMPEKCGLCPCFHAENPMYCQAVKADKNKRIFAPYGEQRPEWCPLRETDYKQLDERLKKVEKVIGLLIQHCPEIDFVELMRKEKRNGA